MARSRVLLYYQNESGTSPKQAVPAGRSRPKPRPPPGKEDPASAAKQTAFAARIRRWMLANLLVLIENAPTDLFRDAYLDFAGALYLSGRGRR